jgi:hypothetical protein
MLKAASGRVARDGTDVRAPSLQRTHWRPALWSLAALAFAGVLGLIIVSYQRDIQQARQRVAIGSDLAKTACGPRYTRRGGAKVVVSDTVVESGEETVRLIENAAG